MAKEQKKRPEEVTRRDQMLADAFARDSISRAEAAKNIIDRLYALEERVDRLEIACGSHYHRDTLD